MVPGRPVHRGLWLADGYYLLESLVDPDDTIVETEERDNNATTLIRLTGERAQVVG